MRCSCHVFNLSAKDGLNDPVLKDSLAKLRYFCKKIHSSSKRTQDLALKCERFKEPNIKVVLPVDIRWNTDLDMCETAFRMKQSITSLSEIISGDFDGTDVEIWNALTDVDWKNAQLAIDLLEPYHQSK